MAKGSKLSQKGAGSLDLALHFTSAMVSTLLAGVAARLLAHFFAATEYSARHAGFLVAVGWVAGQHAYSGPLGTEAAVAAMQLFGGLLALAVLWLWLIRRTGDET